MAGRGHVEPDDGLELGEEGGIARALEGADAVRLQPRCAAQIRCTVRKESPVASAIARPVQWVASPGGAPQVSATTRRTLSSGVGALPGLRVLSRNSPSTPASA